MSKMTPKNELFIETMERTARRTSSALVFAVCYYDGGPYSLRDYAMDVTVNRTRGWNWEMTDLLKAALREAGATNILCKYRKAISRDYLDLAFDIKTSYLKNHSSPL